MNQIFSSTDFLDYTVRPVLKNDSEFIEMTEFESAFLCGLLQKHAPKKILEVGCSAGGSTALILESLSRTGSDAELFSVDINAQWYRDPSKKTCFVADRLYGTKENWHRYFGSYLPEIIEGFDQRFDFCVLDTVHLNPGEILDFCCIVPFMNIGGILVIHDIHLHIYNARCPFAFVNNMVFNASVGRKILCKDTAQKNILPNIAALEITEDTEKNLANVFQLLSSRWFYELDDRAFYAYYLFFEKHFGSDFSEYFLFARDANRRVLLEQQLLAQNSSRQ